MGTEGGGNPKFLDALDEGNHQRRRSNGDCQAEKNHQGASGLDGKNPHDIGEVMAQGCPKGTDHKNRKGKCLQGEQGNDANGAVELMIEPAITKPGRGKDNLPARGQQIAGHQKDEPQQQFPNGMPATATTFHGPSPKGTQDCRQKGRRQSKPHRIAKGLPGIPRPTQLDTGARSPLGEDGQK